MVVRVNPTKQFKEEEGQNVATGQTIHATFDNIEAAKAALTYFTHPDILALFASWATSPGRHKVEPSVDIHRNRPGGREAQKNQDRYWGNEWWEEQEKAFLAQERTNKTRAGTPHPYHRRRNAYTQ